MWGSGRPCLLLGLQGTRLRVPSAWPRVQHFAPNPAPSVRVRGLGSGACGVGCGAWNLGTGAWVMRFVCAGLVAGVLGLVVGVWG